MKESLTVIYPVKKTAIKFITQSPQSLLSGAPPGLCPPLEKELSWEDRDKTEATFHNPKPRVHSHTTGHARAVKPREVQGQGGYRKSPFRQASSLLQKAQLSRRQGALCLKHRANA